MKAAAQPQSRRQVISFLLESELMGFDLKYLEKVLEAGEFSFVPRAPSFLRGAINHHGKVIAAVDLRGFLGMGPAPIGLDSRILVLSGEEYQLGFLVDRVVRIETVPSRGPLVQAPEPGESNPYISRMINLGGRVLHLIDMEKLLLEIENYFA